MAKTKKSEDTPKKKTSEGKMVFLTNEQAEKTAERMRNNDPDWAADMTHEESVLHPKAINRSC